MTPDQFTQHLRLSISESGEAFSPFTGCPSKGIPSPIGYRLFGPDFDLCPNITVKDENGVEFFIYSVDWKHNFALVGLIPVPVPADEPA